MCAGWKCQDTDQLERPATFSNVGIANTGQMSGTISGNSQHIEVNESANNFSKPSKVSKLL